MLNMSLTIGKSLMYIRNNNGPKTEPCGTPVDMGNRVGVKYSTCTGYLYLSSYLSVLNVLEYLVYGNIKVLVLVLVLDHKVLGT